MQQTRATPPCELNLIVNLRFLKLTTDWPEVMLKVTLFNAGSLHIACGYSPPYFWVTCTYLLGSQKGMGLQRFAGICMYLFLFFVFVCGGCSASAGLSDSATSPVVDAQRESLRGLKRKRFE